MPHSTNPANSRGDLFQSNGVNPLIPPAVPAAAPVRNTGLNLRRILIVDDHEDSADSLARLLQLMGHDVVTAHDGLTAVETAETYRPDVVLLDLALPKLDGYSAAKRIREKPWAKHVLMIAATGWGRAADRNRSIAAGFDHHMVKPVDLTELVTLMSTRVNA